MSANRPTSRKQRIALTGFMGVGKTSVARHLANRLGFRRLDLDSYIERLQGRQIAEIIDCDGIDEYRRIETESLRSALNEEDFRILSLGGGTWTTPLNRELIVSNGIITVWLNASFEHCWKNIRGSRKERPLARNKTAARQLFEDRQAIYCLADWHFVVRPDLTTVDVSKQIADEIFS